MFMPHDNLYDPLNLGVITRSSEIDMRSFSMNSKASFQQEEIMRAPNGYHVPSYRRGKPENKTYGFELIGNEEISEPTFLLQLAGPEGVAGGGSWGAATDGIKNPMVYTNPTNLRASGPVIVANNFLFGGSSDSEGALFAMNVDTGKILWTYNTSATIYGGVSVSDGCVYVANGYKVSLGAAKVRPIQPAKKKINIHVEGEGNTILKRYSFENLYRKIGDADLPAIGFAMGIERLVNYLDSLRDKWVDMYLQPGRLTALYRLGVATEGSAWECYSSSPSSIVAEVWDLFKVESLPLPFVSLFNEHMQMH
ncbi:hypothetical protein FRX31_033197 [Thalictrum thalictroides]|uniref:Uncharacterized protein n=1 Tax=Thalictrum thalictroides TaxID=46969 RepID=A0A7J6UX86_THATH|nr:hypothetical protein FRX31_033197 [Thalictrum thalictroides]